MDVIIPSIPTGVVTLLAFFSPYIIAVVNNPWWSAAAKRTVAIVGTLVLAALSLLFYYLITGEAIPTWPQFILAFLVISQAAYALVLKPSVKILEASVGTRGEIEELEPSER